MGSVACHILAPNSGPKAGFPALFHMEPGKSGFSGSFDATVAHWPQLANWFSVHAEFGVGKAVIRCGRGFDF